MERDKNVIAMSETHGRKVLCIWGYKLKMGNKAIAKKSINIEVFCLKGHNDDN
ncbi:MAG: hypothetical protein Q4D52_02405 [Eubacteriales bacterium]|nr:hypothetical protein [Eubacteriales bacterium]